MKIFRAFTISVIGSVDEELHFRNAAENAISEALARGEQGEPFHASNGLFVMFSDASEHDLDPGIRS